MTREQLIQEIIGVISPAAGVAKSGMRLAKHDAKTTVSKVKHRVGVATGKNKAGSHWSSSK
jgi:hypothetical protein